MIFKKILGYLSTIGHMVHDKAERVEKSNLLSFVVE